MKSNEAENTEQDSLLLTRTLLRSAIFNISYIRGLFPVKYFKNISVPVLDIKIKKLMPMDAESRRLIGWMEKGVYDALQKKYLKTLIFCICETVDGPMIEEYAFSFSYSDSDSQDVRMNINLTENKSHGRTLNFTADITPNQMSDIRSSACKMVHTLVQLMRTLDRMPDERTIVMKLLYYDDVTPPDYEPPFFRGCTEEEAQYVWTKNPLRMEIGNVNSQHLVLTLKVKSVLDPCEDENDDMQDDGKSKGPDSVHDEKPSNLDSKINQTQENQFIVAPVDKKDDDNGEVDGDDTQDPVENEQQLARVKDWINSRHLNTLDLTDILSHFPDTSAVLSEEIMDQLEKEGVISKTGKDNTYIKNRDKTPENELTLVKDEADGQTAPKDGKPISPDDYMYMKALSRPMIYVTTTQPHNVLDGEANQTTVRKSINRLTQEGYAVNGVATNNSKDDDTVNCCQASQDRRCRKTSMVQKPILQSHERVLQELRGRLQRMDKNHKTFFSKYSGLLSVPDSPMEGTRKVVATFTSHHVFSTFELCRRRIPVLGDLMLWSLTKTQYFKAAVIGRLMNKKTWMSRKKPYTVNTASHRVSQLAGSLLASFIGYAILTKELVFPLTGVKQSTPSDLKPAPVKKTISKEMIRTVLAEVIARSLKKVAEKEAKESKTTRLLPKIIARLGVDDERKSTFSPRKTYPQAMIAYNTLLRN